MGLTCTFLWLARELSKDKTRIHRGPINLGAPVLSRVASGY